MISTGTTKDIEFPKGERTAEAEVGRTKGLIILPVTQIENEHLYFRLKKELDSNDYEITVRRGGPVLMKSELGENFEKMTSSETFTDAEIKELGGLRFRLGDRIRDDEMKMYIEIGLNWDHVPVAEGKKIKKRFFITVEKIAGNLKSSDQEGLDKLVDPDEED